MALASLLEGIVDICVFGPCAMDVLSWQYMDLMSLERDTVIEAHVDESSGDELE